MEYKGCNISHIFRYDAEGKIVMNSGFEFTISARGSVPLDTTLEKAESVVHTAVVELIEALMNGIIH